MRYMLVALLAYFVVVGVVYLSCALLDGVTPYVPDYNIAIGMIDALVSSFTYAFFLAACIEYFRVENKIETKSIAPIRNSSRVVACILALFLSFVLATGREFVKEEMRAFMPTVEVSLRYEKLP